ncbi:glycosyl hydrolase [Cohnella hongkongensis]|uniref:Glycosyl hydrolase n=1 Tax=Cohnella hongkongensis TaxID=178337 RepID=A0ABV9FKE4_9BACL
MDNKALTKPAFPFDRPPRHLGALFWLHGTESEAELRQTFDSAVGAGIGELTLESRPHWDYLGPKWWKDLKLILSWCQESGVDAYLFDEKWYPSGVAGNTIQHMDPAFLRSSIRLQYIRYRGPISRVSLMPPWTSAPRSTILSAYAYPIEEGLLGYERGEALALSRPDSPHMHGIMHAIDWSVPPGDWIVCFVVEDRSDNYIDPLHPGAVEAFRERVYESSKTELGHFFGGPLKGFFFDEPLYYNEEQQIPWGYELRRRFIEAQGYDPMRWLPALWLTKESPAAASFLYDYYEVLNGQYAETYCRPLYEWCEQNGLKYIGHWYEHEACPAHGERYMFHTRTGEGPGDFFKVSKYAHEGGIDVVGNQVLPGYRNRDYWGLPKLGSSAAHIYGLEGDLALSESFGAYGWHLGLRMMKWLTDWQVAKGINHFILHAFNPQWPDLDCPPYYADGGCNPQWRYFSDYTNYANRLQAIFRGGRHVASLLLLYPGSLAYAGESTPIEDIQQALCEHQYDYDLIPEEEFIRGVRSEDGSLAIGKEKYRGLVIPGVSCLSVSLLHKLAAIAEAGIPVLIADRYPERVVAAEPGREEANEAKLVELRGIPPVGLVDCAAKLPAALAAAGIEPQLLLDGSGGEGLRVLHRVGDAGPVWFVNNESLTETAEGWFRMTDESGDRPTLAWEPLTGERWRPVARGEDLWLSLPPYRSLILTTDSVLLSDDGDAIGGIVPAPYRSDADVLRRQGVSGETISFEWNGTNRAGLVHWLELDPSFSGTVVYRWNVELEAANQGERLLLDLGQVEEIAEVSVNGTPVGRSIAPPYRFDITSALRAGSNGFEVRITNVVSNRMSREPALDPLPEAAKAARSVYAVPQEGGLLGPVSLEWLREAD